MKIIGQPENYSEILQRVFWCSVGTGFLCTLILATASPAVKALIESIEGEADIGPVKGVAVLYVLIPFGAGFIARIIKLHNKVSDLLRIRLTFDTKYLLFPLCRDSGVTLSDDLKKKIRNAREDAMNQTFYEYASFIDPKIHKQLVRTAADNWGWFWVLIESSFLLSLTTVILMWWSKWSYVKRFFLWFILFELIMIIYYWFACIRSAKPQVDAILNDTSRKDSIAGYFNSL